MNQLSRRKWLTQSSTLLAGIGFAPSVFANDQNQLAPYADTDEAIASYIEISQNENPYGPPPKAVEAMMKVLNKGNRYPDDHYPQLLEAIGKKFNVSSNNVLLGAGSSELLGLTAAYCASLGGNAVSAHPTFKLWYTAAENYGLQIIKVPLREDKVHDLPAMLKAINKDTRMVYIVNPHNPTGTVLDVKALEDFIAEASKNAVVLLDEAYTEYSDEPSLAHLVLSNPNLVVAKTFSKIYGMAGIRAGYVLAHESMIKKLGGFAPWPNGNISNISIAAANGALTDTEFVKLSRTKNDQVKMMVSDAMKQMGYRFIPSHTNFIYYDQGIYKGDLSAALDKANIRSMRIYEKETNWRRTSIGTMEEMKRFIAVLKG